MKRFDQIIADTKARIKQDRQTVHETTRKISEFGTRFRDETGSVLEFEFEGSKYRVDSSQGLLFRGGVVRLQNPKKTSLLFEGTDVLSVTINRETPVTEDVLPSLLAYLEEEFESLVTDAKKTENRDIEATHRKLRDIWTKFRMEIGMTTDPELDFEGSRYRIDSDGVVLQVQAPLNAVIATDSDGIALALVRVQEDILVPNDVTMRILAFLEDEVS